MKFTLLSRDLSIATGESTPALAIRRRGVEQTYTGLVDAMDAGGGGA